MDDASLHPIALGAPGRPYPTMGTSRTLDDGTYIPPTLEALEEPLLFYSKRPYAEVMGLALRELPYPSMLSLQQEGIIARQPDARRKLRLTVGPRAWASPTTWASWAACRRRKAP